VPSLTLPVEPPWARSNWQSYCVQLPEWCDQRMVMQEMLDKGISTRRGVMNAHLEASYLSTAQPVRLAHSEAAQQRGVILPLVASMTVTQVKRVCNTLVAAIGSAAGAPFASRTL